MPTFGQEELQAIATLVALSAQRMTGYPFVAAIVGPDREIWINTGHDAMQPRLSYNFMLKPVEGDLMTPWTIQITTGGKRGKALLNGAMFAMRGVDDEREVVKMGNGIFTETYMPSETNTLLSAANRLVSYIERVVAWDLFEGAEELDDRIVLTEAQSARMKQLHSTMAFRRDMAMRRGLRHEDEHDHRFELRLRLTPYSDDIGPAGRAKAFEVLQGALVIACEGGTHLEDYGIASVEERRDGAWKTIVGEPPRQD